MKYLVLVLGVLVAVQGGSVANKTVHLCEGFAAKNDQIYPVGTKMSFGAFMNVPTGITEVEYNEMLDRVEALLAPEVAAKGKTLIVNRLWTSSEANAYAHREGDTWEIDMHGGLARHPIMSADGYALVACHEMGHHLGGGPFHLMADPLSNEGQSDYYASLKCFRRLFTVQENREWAKTAEISPLSKAECKIRFASQASQLACMRAAQAGLNLGMVLSSLNSEPAVPAIGELDKSIVKRTQNFHPKAQCRVDTYFNGAVCNRRTDSKVSDTDYRAGSCEKVDGYTFGFRPRCWFAPADADPVLLDKVAAL
ncbi:MAG: hypothetical protein AABZ31_10800 [Bdellovibrionota bacterium]